MAQLNHLFLFTAAFYFFIFSGCKKEESVNPLQCLDCEFSCLIDDKEFIGTITECGLSAPVNENDSGKLYLYVTENNPVDGGSDRIQLYNIPLSPGRYAVKPLLPVLRFPGEPSAFMTQMNDRGQEISFSVADSLESYVDVEYVNLETKEWKILFHLEMKVFYYRMPPLGYLYLSNVKIREGFAKGKFPD